jgi:hypothetical protein
MAEKQIRLKHQSTVVALPRNATGIRIDWHEDEARAIKICGPTRASARSLVKTIFWQNPAA